MTGVFSLCQRGNIPCGMLKAVGSVHAKQKRVTSAAGYMNWDAIFVVNLRLSVSCHDASMYICILFFCLFSNTATLHSFSRESGKASDRNAWETK